MELAVCLTIVSLKTEKLFLMEGRDLALMVMLLSPLNLRHGTMSRKILNYTIINDIIWAK